MWSFRHGLAQDYSNSIADTLESLQSCTKPFNLVFQFQIDDCASFVELLAN